MLSRQARCGVSIHRAVTLRSLGASSRLPSIQTQNPALVRQYMVTRQTQPWRRGLRLGLGLQERNLATAVDEFSFDGMPYKHASGSSIPPFNTGPSVFDLHNFDPTLPLTIPEPPPPRSATKTNTYGIPGDTDDMLPVFEACLRVGKLERAELVLKRFNNMGILSGEEQIVLNNRYLRASLNQMRTSPDRKQAERLHKWYELQIRGNSLPHTAETIACMLKASLLSERGVRLNRLVTRYMGMAPGEAGLQVLSMADILSDQDLAVITEICPTYNFTAEGEEMEGLEDLTYGANEQGEATTSPIVANGAEASTELDTVPELLPTPQKGEGLSTLKQGLGLLFGLQDADLSKLPHAERQDIQLQLERDSISSAIVKWRLDNEKLQKRGISSAIGPSAKEGSISQHMGAWLDAMERRIKEEVILTKKSEDKESKSDEDLDRCLYGPIIQQGNPARLAAITILSILNLSAMLGVDKGLAISKLVTHVAKMAQEDIELHQQELVKKNERKQRKVTFNAKATKPAKATKASKEPPVPTVLIEDATKVEQALDQDARKPWSMQVKAQVGSVLLKMLMESAKVKVTMKDPATKELLSQYQPAFSHMQQTRKGKKIGVVVLNSHLVAQLQKEPVGDFIAKHLPMIVEPKSWQKFNEGGFLDSSTSFVRVKAGHVEQRLYANAAIKNGDMNQVFKGLDVLGKTPWIINRDVLNVMMEAWNTGEQIANFPPLEPDLQVPPEPDSSADPLLRSQWIKAVKSIENERSGMHSQRCFMNLQLEIARAFRNQTIYFPHNVDYRGRAYPMPTYLNHMGADHARAMLKFGKGKELGVRGLRWLKIHFANVYGLDKASFDEREAFANDNVANIVESATNPLKGSRWWLQGEDPWQCLSACFELKAALELPDPTKYISHLPVHQDGTCNGLQHYAALGGDTWGAKQVNLEPGDKPADVYSAVANLVKDAIAKEAEEKNPFAVALVGKITRKVVKQTVMTNVYGVTFAGAKKQVCKQIDALYPTLGKEVGIPNLVLSTYIAKHIFTALATMFRGAHDIQYWLGDIGGRVCRTLTASQLEQIAESYAEGDVEANTRKTKAKKSTAAAKSGFDELTQQFRSTVVWTTPLHASHMLLSALECHERGLDFAAVHDSFWTHAGDIDVMNEVLREAFIRIHEEDVVGRLAAEFEARHKGSLYLAHIDADSPVAKKIKELRKKSGLTPKEELLLEHQRNQLKLSGNPWDLETAMKIVTPAAVYEEMSAAEEDIDIMEDNKDIGLGEIPEAEAAELAREAHEEMMANEANGLGEFNERLIGDLTTNVVEVNMSETKKKKKAAPKRKLPVPVWMPLTIPVVPKKGDFDVKRLRDSKYFFS
ncbi:DNA-directed RNA polymerase [Cladobotryum mycophilum]|uniref:DNA-directed RNA polymerase n=1 Tax=Cladobotryum mycophilum TaxID=491253 RepID=A0ABR0SGQ4_9HYPO